MTENIYQRWKRRYPILNHMREDLDHAKESIDCTAILHNISMLWDDEIPPLEPGQEDDRPQVELDGGQGDDPDDINHEYVIVEDVAPR